MVELEDVVKTLSDWSRNRLRFHPSGIPAMPALDDPARTLSYGLYRWSLIRSGNEYLIQKWDLDQLAFDVEGMKKLSEYMKKFGERVEPKWRLLVDMHRLNDFIEPPPVAEFKDDIRDWVTRQPKHTWNGDEEEWYRRFEDAMRRVLFRSGSKPDKIISVDEFISNGDIWCTSGSGFEPEAEKLKVFDKNRQDVEEVKKNKWSVRWSLSRYKTKRLLFKRRPQICKAVPKSEPAKVRAVISSDLSLYLKMTYVSLFLDKILKGRTDSTLWMSDEARFQLWQSMAYDDTWRMPLDQSEFDKNQTKRQVLITVRGIKELIKFYGAPNDMLEIMDEIEFSLTNGYVLVDGERIYITNGILSGWRWTALLDTLINLAEAEMAQDWVRENSHIDPGVVSLNAQGDDDWFKFKTRVGAIATWLAYESFGLFVNPGKFFLSKTRDEYLRRVYDGGVVTGYPARSISSILFRNPVSDKENVGADRIRSTFGKWKLFSERMGIDFRNSWFFTRFTQDAVQGTRGVSKLMIENYVDLSALNGGIGLDNKGFFDCVVPGRSVSVPDSIDILGEGYKEWVEFLSPYGVSDKSCNRFAVSTLDLGGKYGWPSWVKYVYTGGDFKLEGIDNGSEVNRPGTIAIGKQNRLMAFKKRWRWFPTIANAKSMTHYVLEDNEGSRYVDYDKIKVDRSVGKSFRLEVVDGLSMTAAQLSDDPSLVFKNYDPEMFAHKPKSWVKDYISGKLKASVGPRSGWGVDVTGHISKKYFSTITNIYLATSRPTIRLWNSLLAALEATVSLELLTLPVRVVE